MRLVILTLISLLPVFFICCSSRNDNPCPDKKSLVHRISSNHKEVIPYSCKERLFFYSSNGDTCELPGSGATVSQNPAKLNTYTSGNPDCPYVEDEMYENYGMVFHKEMQGFSNLWLLSYVFNPYSQRPDNLWISFKGYVNWNIDISYLLDEKNQTDTVRLSQTSFVVATKIFSKTYPDQGQPNDSNILYYNLKEGVVKIILKDGTSWTKKQ